MAALILLLLIALIIVIIGIAKAFSAFARVGGLEREVGELRSLDRRIQALEQIAEDMRAGSPRKPAPAIREQPPALATPEPQAYPAQTVEARPSSPPPPAPPSRTREEWEAFVGGKLLNRIGALALILGIGFFLKYAFDNDWISESLRVLIGATAGFVCLAGAWRTHRRGFQVFAQGLVGAGLAILYLSGYASFNYYHLVPQWMAFVLMSGITILAIGQAFLYDSLATALLGLAGGFLTPMLLSTGTANEVGLFSYLALLDIGLFATVIRKSSWQALEPLALIGTWGYYATWYASFFAPGALGVTLFFVAVFWFLHFASDTLRLGGMRLYATEVQHATLVVNTGVAFAALFVLIDQDHHAWMGTATLALALPYALAVMFFHRRSAADPLAEPRNALIAISLLVIATAIEFAGLALVRWWTLEAAALLLIGLTRRMPVVWRSAPVLLALAALKFLITDGALHIGPMGGFTLVFNLRFVTLMFFAVVSAGGAVLLRGVPESAAGPERRWLVPVLESAAAVAIVLLVVVEMNDLFIRLADGQPLQEHAFLLFVRTLAIAAVSLAIAAGLIELSRRAGTTEVTAVAVVVAGIALFTLIVAGIAFDPLVKFVPAWNLRAGLMVISVGLGAVTVTRLRRNAERWAWCGRVLPAIGIGVVALLLALFTGETRDYYELLLTAPDLSREAIERLNSIQQLALSGVWLVFSLCLIGFGIWRGLRMPRLVAIALFGFTILKIFIYDLSFLQTLYRIFSFVGLGVILLTVSYAYQRYKYIILPERVN